MSNKATRGGMGFVEALTLVFIILKLTGNITWSWWWVLSPLWIGFAVVLVALVIFAIIAILLRK